MSAVSALLADIASFATTHGRRPRKIRMHPFDINELQNELCDSATTTVWLASEYAPTEHPERESGYVMLFIGIPVYPDYQAVIARPWLDV